ncbi:MAG TPA: hypothetical protein VEK57_04435 [Thermoanaerobaculia bacterium]|nr:hypothetical protein [Thermoanaerobaculia bacterium]
MSVVQTWRSLNAEQKRILLDKRLEVTRPIDELLALLKPLAACDARADQSRTRLGCSFGLALVLTVAALIAWGNDVPFAMATALVLLAAAIALGYFYFWTKRIDVSNNFRQFALPVLSVFREDIDAAPPVRLKLDLGSPTAASKKQSEKAPYSMGVYHKVIESTYLDPWMSAEAVLVDGTKLSWQVTDSIRELQKTKRNPGGKYKTKTKYTKKTDLEVRLGIRKKTYDVTAPAGAEVTSGAKRNVVVMERQIRSATLDPIDPRALIDLIAGVYRNARRARKEAGA